MFNVYTDIVRMSLEAGICVGDENKFDSKYQ